MKKKIMLLLMVLGLLIPLTSCKKEEIKPNIEIVNEYVNYMITIDPLTEIAGLNYSNESTATVTGTHRIYSTHNTYNRGIYYVTAKPGEFVTVSFSTSIIAGESHNISNNVNVYEVDKDKNIKKLISNKTYNTNEFTIIF